jgi:hypothetical protein
MTGMRKASSKDAEETGPSSEEEIRAEQKSE